MRQLGMRTGGDISREIILRITTINAIKSGISPYLCGTILQLGREAVEDFDVDQALRRRACEAGIGCHLNRRMNVIPPSVGSDNDPPDKPKNAPNAPKRRSAPPVAMRVLRNFPVLDTVRSDFYS